MACAGAETRRHVIRDTPRAISARLQSEVFEVSEVAVPRNDIRPRAKTKTGPNLEA